MEPPDLVLAIPVTISDNRGARGGVAVVGQVNVLVGILGGDAAIRLRRDFGDLSEFGLPPTITVVFVGADVPLPWVAGVDSNDAHTVPRCLQEIEILPVVHVLDGPAVTVLDNLPLWDRD